MIKWRWWQTLFPRHSFGTLTNVLKRLYLIWDEIFFCACQKTLLKTRGNSWKREENSKIFLLCSFIIAPRQLLWKRMTILGNIRVKVFIIRERFCRQRWLTLSLPLMLVAASRYEICKFAQDDFAEVQRNSFICEFAKRKLSWHRHDIWSRFSSSISLWCFRSAGQLAIKLAEEIRVCLQP